MKSIMFVLVILVLLAGCAMTPIPAEQRQVVKIYEVELSKDEIFNKANEWIARAFVDHDAVVEYSDKSTGKIYGNGIITVWEKNITDIERKCKFAFKIEIKEGRFRATAEDITMRFMPGDPYVPISDYYHQINDDAKAIITAMFDDLNSTMTEKEDDW